MSKLKDTQKEQMLLNLRKAKGVVLYACEAIGIDTQTHYKWMTTDPDYKEVVEGIQRDCLDFAERQLFKLMEGAEYEIMTEHGIQTLRDAPSATATIFYLKTKGKSRGYVERQEITGAEGGPIQIIAPDEI